MAASRFLARIGAAVRSATGQEARTIVGRDERGNVFYTLGSGKGSFRDTVSRGVRARVRAARMQTLRIAD